MDNMSNTELRREVKIWQRVKAAFSSWSFVDTMDSHMMRDLSLPPIIDVSKGSDSSPHNFENNTPRNCEIGTSAKEMLR